MRSKSVAREIAHTWSSVHKSRRARRLSKIRISRIVSCPACVWIESSNAATQVHQCLLTAGLATPPHFAMAGNHSAWRPSNVYSNPLFSSREGESSDSDVQMLSLCIENRVQKMRVFPKNTRSNSDPDIICNQKTISSMQGCGSNESRRPTWIHCQITLKKGKKRTAAASKAFGP